MNVSRRGVSRPADAAQAQQSSTARMTAKQRAQAAADIERRRQHLLDIFTKMAASGNDNDGSGGRDSTFAADGRRRSRPMKAAATGSGGGGSALARPSLPPQLQPLSERPRGESVAFVRGGRSIVLSGGSRRLPPVFAQQRETGRAIDVAVHGVNATLRSLTYDLSRVTDVHLPAETLQAVEDSHRAYTDALAIRSGRVAGSDENGNDSGRGGGGYTGGLFLPYTLRGSRLGSDWLMRLQQARAAAADECVSDMQSVADYAGDPAVPRPSRDRRTRDEMESMNESLVKIAECAAAMRAAVSGNPADRLFSFGDQDTTTTTATVTVPATLTATATATSGGGPSSYPWWSSALRTRDLKAHAIRLNHHARRALLWDWRCREHLLLDAAHLNHNSERCRMDLIRLQSQLAIFAQRHTDSEVATRTLQEEAALLQTALAEAGERRGAMQLQLLESARLLGLVPDGSAASNSSNGNNNDHNGNGPRPKSGSGEPLSAELALLVLGYAWPRELRADAARALDWLRTEQTFLE